VYNHILVPIDGSGPSAAGVREAIKIARLSKGAIRLVHVVNEMQAILGGDYSPDLRDSLLLQAENLVKDVKAEVESQGIKAETLVIDALGGPTGQVIVGHANAWPAQLIVIGTHGRRGLARLVLGSDAEYVVRTASVPVMLVRGTGTTF
jgi:nucleotide-binding universal stress UspA family protein